MRYLPLAFALIFFTACQTDDATTTTTTDDAATDDYVETDAAASWQTTLDAEDGFDGVSGSANAEVRDGQTHATANVSGATAGGTHPWHIHSGTCGSGGGIVGDAGAYPALQIGDDGTASAEAHINLELDADANYYVNVHASQDDMATIVACGELSRN